MHEISRNVDGTWPPGQSGNPEGAKARKGWQPSGLRLQHYMDMPGDELEALINDPDRLRLLSAVDKGCVRYCAEISGGKAWMDAMERALNRIEGSPKQVIDMTTRPAPQISDNATPDELADAMATIRSQG
jgi:hypothetical protein